MNPQHLSPRTRMDVLERSILAVVAFLLLYYTGHFVHNWIMAWLSGLLDSSLAVIDKIVYGLTFALPGTLTFRYLLPHKEGCNQARSSLPRRPLSYWTFVTGLSGMSGALLSLATIPLVMGSGSIPVPGEIPATGAPGGASLCHGWSTTYLASMIIAAVGLGPVLEEIFYRNSLLCYLGGANLFLRENTGKNSGVSLILAIALSSLLFALTHSGAAFIMVLAAGVLFGILYVRFGLTGSIFGHAFYNMSLFVLDCL